MSYIDNTCQGLLLADQVDSANGQTFWIADENPYSMNEIIDTVKNLLKNEFNQIVSEIKGVKNIYVFPHMADGGIPYGSAALANFIINKPTISSWLLHRTKSI